MQISPDLVKWDVVTVKADKGTLLDDLYEIEEDVDWAETIWHLLQIEPKYRKQTSLRTTTL